MMTTNQEGFAVKKIRVAMSAALIAATVSLQPIPSMAQGNSQNHRKDHREYKHEWKNYDYRHYEPGQTRYDAARYYRQDNGRYPVRRLGRNDRLYRGSDTRYYCRRDDGTTGLIIGATAGGVLGNIIAPGESKILGTIIGAGAGALLGREIDRGDITCR